MVNKDEFAGGAGAAGGEAKQMPGDQVAGRVQKAVERARSAVEDAIDAAPNLAEEAGARLKAAGARLSDQARDTPLSWLVAAVVGGYALAWFVHGRRD